MVPDLDLQLQASLKALADTIGPAVDPTDKVATEQLGLVVATLTMVRARLPIQRRLIRRLLEDAISLGEAFDAESHIDALGEALAGARAALADPELEAHELERVRAALTSRIVSLLATADGDAIKRVGGVVLKRSGASIERLRAWCVPSGFEGASPAIPAIDSLI